MRLSKDSSSWKAQGLKKRYYPEHSHSLRLKRKATKKWCKGKEGMLHDLYLKKAERLSWFADMLWIEWRCTNCGKRFLETHHR